MPKAKVTKINGVQVLIETDEDFPVQDLIDSNENTEGIPSTMRPVGAKDLILNQFADVKEVIVACCNQFTEIVEEIPTPDTISLEFGIRLVGEAGVPMLTKASAESNFTIGLEWKKKADQTIGTE